VPREEVAFATLEHLVGRCPTCARELARWNAWKEVRGTPAGTRGVVTALRMLLATLPARLAASATELRHARRAVAALRPLGPEARRDRFRRSHGRFRGPAFAELALAEARAALPGHPANALSWACIAELGVGFVPPARGLDDAEHQAPAGRRASLLGRALAHQGNALRILERFDEAEVCFEAAHDALRKNGATDLAAFAEVACLEASLHRDRRDFSRAEEALHHASLLYAVLEDRRELARARLKRGTLYHAWGRAGEALGAAEAAEAALAAADPAEPRLLLAARHNRADYLCDLYRFREAADLLEESRALYEAFGDAWTRLRLAWLEGKIARGLGRDEEAEARLRAARDGFRAEGSAYDAALVALELAALYLARGRTSDVRALAREMVETFGRLGVHREAREAARLFARAAAREAVTAELVARLAAYLRQARSGPGFAFRP
jgi:tetratricopeptide (TPR) repeat protein